MAAAADAGKTAAAPQALCQGRHRPPNLRRRLEKRRRRPLRPRLRHQVGKAAACCPVTCLLCPAMPALLPAWQCSTACLIALPPRPVAFTDGTADATQPAALSPAALLSGQLVVLTGLAGAVCSASQSTGSISCGTGAAAVRASGAASRAAAAAAPTTQQTLSLFLPNLAPGAVISVGGCCGAGWRSAGGKECACI
jgi:hypothetical protein